MFSVHCVEKKKERNLDCASAQAIPFGNWKVHTDLGGYQQETASLSLKTAMYCAKKKKVLLKILLTGHARTHSSLILYQASVQPGKINNLYRRRACVLINEYKYKTHHSEIMFGPQSCNYPNESFYNFAL